MELKVKKIIYIATMLFMSTTAALASEIQWSWAYQNDNMDEFRLYCATSPGGYNDAQAADVAFLGGNNRTGISSLDDGSVYYCAITAVDDYGVESAFSREMPVDLSAPQPPSNLNGIRIKIEIQM